MPASEPDSPVVAFPIPAPDACTGAQITDWCRSQLRLHLSDAQHSSAGKLIVRWNPRMRSAAGRAFWPHCRIDLNPALLAHGQKEMWTTIRHELAHVLSWLRFGIKISPHGAEWQFCCTLLGIPGESRTHQLPLARRRMARNVCYSCIHCHTIVRRTREFPSDRACAACCRTHNRGKFSRRFLLVRVFPETHPPKP